MFKFSRKKKEEKQVEQTTTQVKKDSWVKNHFIVVPNTTTPDDLTDYQKLIVLRKPEGEQRVIVDFSLTDAETDVLHNESLENDVVNFESDNLLRIIPTSINTKEIDEPEWLSNDEIEEVSSVLTANSEEFRKMEKSAESEEFVPILRMDDANVKIVDDSFYRPSADKVFDVDDIDSVVIRTDEQKQLRESWKDVDKFIFEKEEIDKRKQNKFSINHAKPSDYIPGPQPLFRNFIDTDFIDVSKYNIDKDTLDKPLIGGYKNFDDEVEFFGKDNISISNLPQTTSFVDNDQPVDVYYDGNTNQHVEVYKEHENSDPEIISGLEENEMSPEQKMDDYVSEAVESVPTDEVKTDVVEQPAVLSFFKNKVNTEQTHSNSVQHTNKYIKFYKTNDDERKFKYEKIILNRKKKMYTYRKVLIK